MKTGTWFGRGKLLLTGEYFVMKGAKALAISLKQGQSLQAQKLPEKLLRWNAFVQNDGWFTAEFSLPQLDVVSSNSEKLSGDLKKILTALCEIKPDVFQRDGGWRINTVLDFNPEYGFGSSSTLISNLAASAGVDPYELLHLTFGGSGYDIACTRSDHPIFYELKDQTPVVTEAPFDPPFKSRLYFVYLGKKQVSRTAIYEFNQSSAYTADAIDSISRISAEVAEASSLKKFEQLMDEHEEIMSEILGKPKVKSALFPDLDGSAKSLGAWGGDFVLITWDGSTTELWDYLSGKGLEVVYAYEDIVVA